jgi:hypothetical protein
VAVAGHGEARRGVGVVSLELEAPGGSGGVRGAVAAHADAEGVWGRLCCRTDAGIPAAAATPLETGGALTTVTATAASSTPPLLRTAPNHRRTLAAIWPARVQWQLASACIVT